MTAAPMLVAVRVLSVDKLAPAARSKFGRARFAIGLACGHVALRKTRVFVGRAVVCAECTKARQ